MKYITRQKSSENLSLQNLTAEMQFSQFVTVAVEVKPKDMENIIK